MGRAVAAAANTTSVHLDDGSEELGTSNRTEQRGVVGKTPIVAEHEVLPGRNLHWTERVRLNRRGEIERKANRGAATVEGFELQTQWKLNENTQLLLNHSHINVRALADGLKQSFAESAPSNTLTAMLTHQFTSNWDASIAYYQTSQTTQLGDGDPVDLIRQCNVRVARKFNVGRWGGEVSGVVENLFDNHYQEFADYNTLKRRAYINLRLDF